MSIDNCVDGFDCNICVDADDSELEGFVEGCKESKSFIADTEVTCTVPTASCSDENA